MEDKIFEFIQSKKFIKIFILVMSFLFLALLGVFILNDIYINV